MSRTSLYARCSWPLIVDSPGPAAKGLSQVADPTSAADLAAQLAKQAGHRVSYVIAFYIIAQFWLTTAGSSAT